MADAASAQPSIAQLLQEAPVQSNSCTNSTSGTGLREEAAEPDLGCSVTQHQHSAGVSSDAASCQSMTRASSTGHGQPGVNRDAKDASAGSRSASNQSQPQDNSLSTAASTASDGSRILLQHIAPRDSEAEDDLAPLADVLQTCLTARVHAQYRVTSQAVTRCARLTHTVKRHRETAACPWVFKSKGVGRVAHCIAWRSLNVLLSWCDRLMLHQLRLEQTLHGVSQVFCLKAGDWAASFVEDVARMGSRAGSLTVNGLQRVLEETIKARAARLRGRPPIRLV